MMKFWCHEIILQIHYLYKVETIKTDLCESQHM